ncbi:MAG: fused MFS/spermidine synthase [Gemmatimonadetes bacterium]|nr:fused MFS/spermidine synthase [Gemmatimonadota bacterium]
MTVEILSTRLVARFLGSSLYTWTSAIGVVLGGISLGNYVGGRLADRFPARRTLSLLFILSSLACVTIPVLNNSIGTWTALDSLSWPTRTFLHFILVFLLPATMLGTMSPVVAKMALAIGRSTGRTIGTIYAWGAIGSIVGTFVTGFYLIAWIGVEASILWIAGVLALVGTFYGYRSWIPYPGMGLYFFTVWLTVSSVSTAEELGEKLGLRHPSDESVLFLEDSHYQRVSVITVDDPNERWMVLDSLLHSQVNLSNPLALQYDYENLYDAVMQQVHPTRDPVTAMMIGGGGYVFPRYLELVYTGSTIEVSEIDPVVTEAAFQVFGLPRDTKIRYFNMDGRNRVTDLIRSKGNGVEVPEFDFIFGDSFSDFSVPYHLTTLEFNQDLHRLLTDQGVYMINVIDMFRSSEFLAAVYNTCRRVFEHVYVWAATSLDAQRTTFVVVSSKMPIDMTQVLTSLRTQQVFQGALLSREQLKRLEKTNGGTILTDDYAPVENLLAPVVQQTKRANTPRIIREVDALINDSKLPEAIARLSKVLRTHTGDARLYNQYGQALAQSRHVERAREAFERAVQLQPAIAKYRSNLGLASEELGRDAEAVIHFKECLRLDPKNGPVMNSLALLLATSADPAVRNGSEAVRWAERLVRLAGRSNPQALDTLAAAFAQSRQFSKAVQTAERALPLAKSSGQSALVQSIEKSLELYRAYTPRIRGQ